MPKLVGTLIQVLNLLRRQCAVERNNSTTMMAFRNSNPVSPWKPGEPAHQAYFTFFNSAWQPAVTSKTAHASTAETLVSFSVLSWNIDFMRPLPNARMEAALKHLEFIAGLANQSVIMLNEMVSGDLELIKKADWVRRDYSITDVSVDNWENPGYGKRFETSYSPRPREQT
jgi:hypothetical protein